MEFNKLTLFGVVKNRLSWLTQRQEVLAQRIVGREIRNQVEVTTDEVQKYFERHFSVARDFPVDMYTWIHVAQRGPDRGRVLALVVHVHVRPVLRPRAVTSTSFVAAGSIGF